MRLLLPPSVPNKKTAPFKKERTENPLREGYTFIRLLFNQEGHTVSRVTLSRSTDTVPTP